MDICEWLDDEAIEKLKEDREPFDAPSTWIFIIQIMKLF